MTINKRTTRWWQKPHNRFRMNLDNENDFKCPICGLIHCPWSDPIWKEVNPRFYRHEKKFLRVIHHRNSRRNNKLRLKKGWEIEPEVRTNGWLTH
mgnify:CR=1 FL=1